MESKGLQQRGVVLISVLAVTAVLAAIAWQMVARQSLVLSGASAASFRIQAEQYLLGAEHYARQLLVEDWRNEASRAFDSEDEKWSAARPPFQIPGGTMKLRIFDLQARFNINAIEAYESEFRTLLNTHKIPESAIVQWLDWIDEDSEPRGPGTEDMELLLQEPALRSADQIAGHVSELRYMPAMRDTPLAEIEHLLVALPTTDLSININTVGPELLEALGLSQSLADTLTAGERKFHSLDEINELDAGEGSGYFGVTSNYFAVWGEVEIAGKRARIESRLYRKPDDGSVHLLGRNFESA